jgi:hypothetical protein
VEESFLSAIELYGVNDVRQTEIHTAEPLVPELSDCEVEVTAEKLKRHKSPGTDQIVAIKGGVEQFALKSININSNWNKQEFPKEWKESNNVSVYKKGDKTECSNYIGKLLLSTMYKILCNFFETNFPMNMFSWH